MPQPSRILDRLAGLETEYAIRFTHDAPQGTRPPDHTLYTALLAELRRHTRTVPADHGKEGVFLQTGGAVWYEKAIYRPFALIEGATPECRGPLQLLRC